MTLFSSFSSGVSDVKGTAAETGVHVIYPITVVGCEIGEWASLGSIYGKTANWDTGHEYANWDKKRLFFS